MVNKPLTVGVVNVGLVANTKTPEPVSSDTTALKFAEVGVPNHVATPVPKLVIPVPPDATGNVPVVKTLVDVAYKAPPEVNDVKFVPPLAVPKVPARVTVPVVAVLGVKPVVPALNEVPADGVAQDKVVPLDVRT
jgi:hypothetical protein